MRQHSADGKANMVEALVRRGHSRVEALSLADRLSASPADHKAARERIGEALELRTA
ncbi:hypothetical protein ABZ402_15845 [Streptomyces mirabilis]|uniref:hypothetical protein n=1 Tax=Streptomyces mirabilis TaxID=68239 RepID=UPI0033C588D8